MSRQDRLNKLFLQSLASSLSQEPPLRGALVTIKQVNLDSSLTEAEIKISVLPVNLSGSALKSLRKSSKHLALETVKRIKLAKVPRLIWKIDSSEKELSQLDELFDQIRQENKDK